MAGPHSPHVRPGGVCVPSGCLHRGTVVSPSQSSPLFLSCDAAQTIRAERWMWEPWPWRAVAVDEQLWLWRPWPWESWPWG